MLWEFNVPRIGELANHRKAGPSLDSNRILTDKGKTFDSLRDCSTSEEVFHSGKTFT